MLGNKLRSSLAGVAALIAVSSAHADPFLTLDPDYTQDLVVVVNGGTGVAGVTLGLDGYLYTNGAGGAGLYKWDPNNQVVVNGTTVYSQVASNSGAPGGNWGMTVDSAGGLYSLGTSGLYSINPTTLAGTLVGPGGTYGLAYDRFTDTFFSSTGSSVIETRRDGSTRIVVSSVGGFADQVAIDPTGNFIAGADTAGVVRVWDINTGALVRSINTTFGAPDGMAFDSDGSIFTNNTNGTIAKIVFAGGSYAAGATTQSLIASGGFYGDLAGVGSDGAFYVSQYGIRYDNGVVDGVPGTCCGAGASIVKITRKGGGGFEDGGTGGTGTDNSVPEPATVALLGLGLLGVGISRRRRGAQA